MTKLGVAYIPHDHIRYKPYDISNCHTKPSIGLPWRQKIGAIYISRASFVHIAKYRLNGLTVNSTMMIG